MNDIKLMTISEIEQFYGGNVVLIHGSTIVVRNSPCSNSAEEIK